MNELKPRGPSASPMTILVNPAVGIGEALVELLNAARAGCDENGPDWRYRPAWRQRLAAALKAFDVASGALPAVRVDAREPDQTRTRAVVPVDPASEFDRFWAAYPRKSEGGQLAARTAYEKARKKASAEEILSGLLAYPFRSDPAYQPTATNWLGRGCWSIEQDTAPVTTIRERNGRRHEAAELAEDIGLDLITPIGQQFPEGQTDGFSASSPGHALGD